jgi:hypothetical protein
MIGAYSPYVPPSPKGKRARGLGPSSGGRQPEPLHLLTGDQNNTPDNTKVSTGDAQPRVHCGCSKRAALHGLLTKVRDLGLTLLSANSVEPDTKEVRKT